MCLYIQLKGHPKKDIEAAVAAMAKEVGLELKRNALAGTLSGGQKRKLSVGIALIGGSKVRIPVCSCWPVSGCILYLVLMFLFHAIVNGCRTLL